MTLPASGTLSYSSQGGDVTFSSLFRSKISERPVYDDARRVVKYTELRLEVAGYVSGGASDTTDAQMVDIRRALTEPGGILTYEAKGFGSTFTVNAAGGLRDCRNGPHPELLSYVPIGSTKACFVEWAVTANVNEKLSEPESAKSNTGDVITYNYETTHSIEGRTGLMTVAVSGFLEVAATRKTPGGVVAPVNLDSYRERVAVPLIAGFRRDEQRYTPSSDGTRLTFSVIDKQVPVPLPKGVTDAEVEHSAGSTLVPDGFVNWTGSISGSVTVPPDTAKVTAVDKILLIVFSRLTTSQVTNAFSRGRPSKTIIIDRFRVTDAMFGSAVSFDFGYRLLNSSLGTFLQDCGMFKPVPDANLWVQSLADGAWSVRGAAGLAVPNGSDLLLDLGTDEKPKFPTYAPNQRPSRLPGPLRGRGDVIPEEDSWLHYESHAEYVEEGGTSTHVPLGKQPSLLKSLLDPFAKGFNVKGGNPGLSHWNHDAATHTLQQHGAPRCFLRIHGRAVRLDHRVRAPRLVSVDGIHVGHGPADVHPAGLRFIQKKAGRFGSIPVYVAAWSYFYLMPRGFGKGQGPAPFNEQLKLVGEGVN